MCCVQQIYHFFKAIYVLPPTFHPTPSTPKTYRNFCSFTYIYSKASTQRISNIWQSLSRARRRRIDQLSCFGSLKNKSSCAHHIRLSRFSTQCTSRLMVSQRIQHKPNEKSNNNKKTLYRALVIKSHALDWGGRRINTFGHIYEAMQAKWAQPSIKYGYILGSEYIYIYIRKSVNEMGLDHDETRLLDKNPSNLIMEGFNK